MDFIKKLFNKVFGKKTNNNNAGKSRSKIQVISNERAMNLSQRIINKTSKTSKNYETIQKLINEVSNNGKSKTVELLQEIANAAGFKYNPNGDRIDDYLLPVAKFIGFPNEKLNKKYIKENLCKNLTDYAIKNLSKEEKLIYKIRNIIVECYKDKRYKTEGFIGSIKNLKNIKLDATGNGLPPMIKQTTLISNKETYSNSKGNYEKIKQKVTSINQQIKNGKGVTVESLQEIAELAEFEYDPNGDRIDDYLIPIAQFIGFPNEKLNRKYIKDKLCKALIQPSYILLTDREKLIHNIRDIIVECYKDKRYKTEGFIGSIKNLKNIKLDATGNGLPPMITKKMENNKLNEALEKLNPYDSTDQIIQNLKSIANIVGLKYENTNRFDLEIKIAEKFGLKINNKDELEKFKLEKNNKHAFLLRKIDNAAKELFTKKLKYLGSFQKDYKTGKLPGQ